MTDCPGHVLALAAAYRAEKQARERAEKERAELRESFRRAIEDRRVFEAEVEKRVAELVGQARG